MLQTAVRDHYTPSERPAVGSLDMALVLAASVGILDLCFLSFLLFHLCFHMLRSNRNRSRTVHRRYIE